MGGLRRAERVERNISRSSVPAAHMVFINVRHDSKQPMFSVTVQSVFLKNCAKRTLCHRALSYTRRNAVPGATQVIFASFSSRQFSFSHPSARTFCLLHTEEHPAAYNRHNVKNKKISGQAKQ